MKTIPVPVFRWLNEIERDLRTIERLTTYELASTVRHWFYCANKVGMGRRAARRLKRQMNYEMRGSTTYRRHCQWCGRCHVFSVFEKLDVIDEAEFRMKILSSSGNLGQGGNDILLR